MDFNIKKSAESRKHRHAKSDLFEYYSDKGKYDVYMEYPFFHNEFIDNYAPIDKQIEYCKTHKKLKLKHHKIAEHVCCIYDNCDVEPIGVNGTTFTNKNMPTYSDYCLSLRMTPRAIVDVLIKSKNTKSAMAVEVVWSSYMRDDKVDFLWNYTCVSSLYEVTANHILNKTFDEDFSSIKIPKHNKFKWRQERIERQREHLRLREKREEEFLKQALEPLSSVDIDSINNNFK